MTNPKRTMKEGVKDNEAAVQRVAREWNETWREPIPQHDCPTMTGGNTCCWICRCAAAESRVAYLGNLLAVIHGDGGHYEEEHGTQKAAKDAEAKWYQLAAIREQIEGEK